MKKEYNAMFDKIVPEKSDEELLRAVLSGKAEKTMKNKSVKKAIIITVISVVVLVCK